MPLVARGLGQSCRRLSRKWAVLMPVPSGTRYISAGAADENDQRNEIEFAGKVEIVQQVDSLLRS
jgi:hypothetical protein